MRMHPADNQDRFPVLGICGGIGCGKSTVLLALSQEYHVPVIRTDETAKDLMRPGEPLLRSLAAAFSAEGYEILLADGNLNRTRYADLIYTEPALRSLSDRMVHPAVWDAAERSLADIASRWRLVGSPRFAALETALPGERFRSLCTHVIAVQTNQEIRVRRLMRDRGMTAERCASIIKSQPEDRDYAAIADAVLLNNDGPEEMKLRLRELIRTLDLDKGAVAS